MDAAGKEAKGFTCLQNLIAILCWTGAQAEGATALGVHPA